MPEVAAQRFGAWVKRAKALQYYIKIPKEAKRHYNPKFNPVQIKGNEVFVWAR